MTSIPFRTPARPPAWPDGCRARRDAEVMGRLDDSQPDARRVLMGLKRARPVSGLTSGRLHDLSHRLPMPTSLDVARSGSAGAAKLAYRCGGSAGMAHSLDRLRVSPASRAPDNARTLGSAAQAVNRAALRGPSGRYEGAASAAAQFVHRCGIELGQPGGREHRAGGAEAPAAVAVHEQHSIGATFRERRIVERGDDARPA